MKFDLSFWRFVIFLKIAKQGLWAKQGDNYFFHVGTITNGNSTAVQVIVLPLLLQVGFV